VDSHDTFKDEPSFVSRVSSNISVLTSCYFGGRNASPRNRFSCSQRPRHNTPEPYVSPELRPPTGNGRKKAVPLFSAMQTVDNRLAQEIVGEKIAINPRAHPFSFHILLSHSFHFACHPQPPPPCNTQIHRFGHSNALFQVNQVQISIPHLGP
jgi:hypothetical protein